MLKKDMSKMEIEEFLKGKGDFVQIDHLTRLIEGKDVPIDKKKFIYKKLADLYEKKGMFKEAAKMYNFLAIASVIFAEKIENHIKEAEFCIKAGDFSSSDEAVKKAMAEANINQRAEMFVKVKEFYKQQALVYEKNMKRAQAVKIYEKLLSMHNISEEEKQEIRTRLMNLYEKLGKVKEYFSIKDNKTPVKDNKRGVRF